MISSLSLESGLPASALQGSEFAVTFPDPYGSGPGGGHSAARLAQGLRTHRPPGQGLRPGAAASRVHRRAPGARGLRLRAVTRRRAVAAGDVPGPDVRPGPAGRHRSWPAWAAAIGAYFLSIPLAIVTLGIGYIIWASIVLGQRADGPPLQVLGMRCLAAGDQPGSRLSGTWRCAENPRAHDRRHLEPHHRDHLVRALRHGQGAQRRCTTWIAGPWSCHDPNKVCPAEPSAFRARGLGSLTVGGCLKLVTLEPSRLWRCFPPFPR